MMMMMILIKSIALLLLLVFPYATSALSFNFPASSTDSPNVTLGLSATYDFLPQEIYLTADDALQAGVSTIGWATYAQLLHLWDNSSRKLADFKTNFSFSINSSYTLSYNRGGLAFFLLSNDTNLPDQDAAECDSFGLTSSANEPAGNFIAVEFDIYQNTDWDPVPAETEQPEHVGIDINSLNSSYTTPWLCANITDGTVHHASINYDSESKNLSVIITAGDITCYNSLSYKVDLRDYLTEYVKFGFTAGSYVTECMVFASNGGIYNIWDKFIVHSWSFISSLDQPSVNGTQSPSPDSTAPAPLSHPISTASDPATADATPTIMPKSNAGRSYRDSVISTCSFFISVGVGFVLVFL